MRISDQYEHLEAESIIRKSGIFNDIQIAVHNVNASFKVSRSLEIKKELYSQFNKLGWADKVRIENDNKLTISFIKDHIGLCIQLGNVARTYADILKLDYLGSVELIKSGCIIVPGGLESNLLGANYARFDRLSREIQLFSGIINTPILVLSLSD